MTFKNAKSMFSPPNATSHSTKVAAFCSSLCEATAFGLRLSQWKLKRWSDTDKGCTFLHCGSFQVHHFGFTTHKFNADLIPYCSFIFFKPTIFCFFFVCVCLQGSNLARQIGAVAYAECTAKYSENSVRDVFHVTTLASVSSVHRPQLKRAGSRRGLKRVSQQPPRTEIHEHPPAIRKDRAKSCVLMQDPAPPASRAACADGYETTLHVNLIYWWILVRSLHCRKDSMMKTRTNANLWSVFEKYCLAIFIKTLLVSFLCGCVVVRGGHCCGKTIKK